MNEEFVAGIEEDRINVIFLVDTSGSMAGEPINQLNAAMAEAVHIVELAGRRIETVARMRVIEFNSEAKWLFGDAFQGVEHIDWVPLKANSGTDTNAHNGTDTAGAIDLVSSIMHIRNLGKGCVSCWFPVVVILITDGKSGDPQKTAEAVAKLKSSFKNRDWVRRIVISVTGANHTELANFASIGNIERMEWNKDKREVVDIIDKDVPFVINADGDFFLLDRLLREFRSWLRGDACKALPAPTRIPTVKSFDEDDDEVWD